MKLCISLVVLSIIICAGLSYAGDTYNYKKDCPAAGPKNIPDKWNFYKCECTSYVADKLNEDGVKFSNSYKKIKWGNASNWKSAAKNAGFSVNNTAKKGAVAWFSGHVAYVDRVDGKKVILSEYNYNPPWGYKYSTREINATSVSSFLHIK